MLLFFASHPHFRAEAQKGVPKLRLEPHLLTLVSFAKNVLLGMALGDIFMLQIFGTPSLPAPGTKRTPQTVEPHVLTL